MRYAPRRPAPEIIDFEEDRPYWREVRRHSALRRHWIWVRSLPGIVQVIVGLFWAVFAVLCWFAGWLAMSAAVRAADAPTFDSAKYCELSTALVAGNKQAQTFLIKGCMDLERASEQATRRAQPILWDQVTKECTDLSRAAFGGSYRAFVACLKLQIGEAVLKGDATFTRKR